MSKKIDVSLIKELREKTGAPVMDCKSTLEEVDGDMKQAMESLKMKGLIKAEKRKKKETPEGLIASYIHFGGKIGVLVEVNCQTDFVARTEDFKNLVKDITMHIAASNPTYISPQNIPEKVLEKEKSFYRSQYKNKLKPKGEEITKEKLKKFYSEVCLLSQPFIKNPDITVGEYIDLMIGKLGENIRVRRFIRYQLGE